MLTDSQMRFCLFCLYGVLHHPYFVSYKGGQINKRRAQMLAYHAFWEAKRLMGKW